MKPTRYHPVLVALHWVLAIFVIAALLLGTFVLKAMPNALPGKIEALRVHMSGGIAIFALMTMRFVIRTRSRRPSPATTGYMALDWLAALSHYGFYVLILLMATTGIATGFLSGLFDIVFSASGAALPESFAQYPTRVAHGYIAKALIALVGVHVCAVLYHQFIRKDELLKRVWFGKRF